MNNLSKAEECLQAARSILTDVNGYTIETFLFHMTQFELVKQQIKIVPLQTNLNLETLSKLKTLKIKFETNHLFRRGSFERNQLRY